MWVVLVSVLSQSLDVDAMFIVFMLCARVYADDLVLLDAMRCTLKLYMCPVVTEMLMLIN